MYIKIILGHYNNKLIYCSLTPILRQAIIIYCLLHNKERKGTMLLRITSQMNLKKMYFQVQLIAKHK